MSSVLLGVVLWVSISGGSAAGSDDNWVETSTIGAPAARGYHSAVWTGSKMIIWGGAHHFSATLDTGGLYDPAIDAWTETAIDNVPTPRKDHSTVWTGSEMIVWGGGPTETDSGGRFDPETNIWTTTSQIDAPSARYHHSAIWTGSEMIVWGGWNAPSYLQDGARYSPLTDTWTAISSDGAPSARGRHSAVWTGSEMLVWGGYSTDGVGGETYHASGGRYDPVTDTWSSMVAADPPSSRRDHSAVWTGSEMIVWGGFNGSSNPSSGGRYDPATNSWKATRTSEAPSGRQDHAAVWTGSEMIVWGGFIEPSTYCSTGGRYSPEADRWVATTQTDGPPRRRWHSGVWTGHEMVIWGGHFQDYSSNAWLDDGAKFTPGDWAPVATFPFHEDFEAGVLDDQWEISTIGGGRVSLRTGQPYADFYAAELDEVSGYATSSAELILHMDLSGRDDVMLDFWWHEIDDSFYLHDGVYVSDDFGENWLQILPFSGGISSYQNDLIDIDATAAANGLVLNDHFQIMFRFYDNNYSTLFGGYVLDEVTVRTDALPTLTVDRSGTGSGSVSSDPPGIDCPSDCSEVFSHFTEVNLIAAPDGTSAFVSWDGGADCSDGHLTLLADISCTAIFEAVEPPLFADGFESAGFTAWSEVNQ